MGEPTGGGPAEPSRRRSILSAVYGGLPRPVYWLALGVLVNRAGFFAVPMLLLYLTGELGIAADRAGVLLAMYAAGALASAVGGGWLADKIGRRPTMLLSLFGAAVLWLAVLGARELAALGAALFAAGCAADLYRAASAAMIADVCTPAQRPRAYAMGRMAGNAGMAMGPTLAGLIAEHSFAWVFLGESATALFFALVVLAALPETRPPKEEAAEPLSGVSAVFADRPFLLLCLANLCVVAVYMQQISTLPLFVVGERGLRPSDQGLLLSLNGALIVLFELLVVQRTRRVPPLAAVAFGSAVMGIGFGLLPATAGFWGIAGCVGIWTLGEMIAWPLLPGWVAARAPERLRGRYLGVTGLSSGLALLLGAAGGPWFARHQGMDALWTLCLGVCGLAATLVWALWRWERRRGRG